jgi:Xaa-Pro dipeptidase
LATKERWIFSSMKTEVDAVVIMNGVEPNVDRSFFYATGIPNGLFEGCIAIIEPRKMEVLSSNLEELSSREAGVRTTVFDNDKHRTELLARRLKGMDRIGINAHDLTLSNYRYIKKAVKKTKLVDVTSDMENARLIKQPDEVKKILKACDIATKAGKEIPEFVREGEAETSAAAELNYRMMKLGATGPSFVTAVAFGAKSAEPHYMPMQRRLKKGQFALFDYGAEYGRYVSDITRTFICGSPNAKQKEMYDVVAEAQQAALDSIRAGVHGKDVDASARTVIDKSRFKGRFIHSTGHGLGVSVHDPGSISPSRDMVLKEGMVLTVEPGTYIKGFGGVRIEDDVLVTKNGCKILTPLTKEFVRV